MKLTLPFRILGIVFLIALLFGVRMFEKELFYDPFLAYFKTDFQHNEIPEFKTFNLYISVVYRYLLNGILTLGIIYLLFLNRKYVQLASIIIGILGIILLLVYIFMVETEFSTGFLSVFYVRRFLIQPMFLLILVPAFIYLKNKEKLEK